MQLDKYEIQDLTTLNGVRLGGGVGGGLVTWFSLGKWNIAWTNVPIGVTHYYL